MKNKLIDNDILIVMVNPECKLKYNFKTKEEAKNYFKKMKDRFKLLPDFIKPK